MCDLSQFNTMDSMYLSVKCFNQFMFNVNPFLMGEEVFPVVSFCLELLLLLSFYLQTIES